MVVATEQLYPPFSQTVISSHVPPYLRGHESVAFEPQRQQLSREGVEAVLGRLCNTRDYAVGSCPLLGLEGVSMVRGMFPLVGGGTFEWSGSFPLSIRRDASIGNPALLIATSSPDSASFRVECARLTLEAWKDEIRLEIPGERGNHFEMSIVFRVAFVHQPQSKPASP